MMISRDTKPHNPSYLIIKDYSICEQIVCHDDTHTHSLMSEINMCLLYDECTVLIWGVTATPAGVSISYTPINPHFNIYSTLIQSL